MEDEAERLKTLGGRLDREREPEALRRPMRLERLQLPHPAPGHGSWPFHAKKRAISATGELGDGPDPAQAETGEPGPDIRVGCQQL